MSFFHNLFKRRGEAGGGIAPAPSVPVFAPPLQTLSSPHPAEPASAPARTPNAPEDCATFPLKAITDLFPTELKAILRKQPSEHVGICIPRTLIQPQLASGAVRITLAQLRAATPEIFFHPNGAPAETKVLLPLESVLRQMMPSRRENQRPPAIPVKIPSVFIKAGQQPNGAPARASAEPWYSQRRPTYEAESAPDPQPKQPPAIPMDVKMPSQPVAERHRREQQPTGDAQNARVPAIVAPADHFAIPLASVLASLPPEIHHALNGADAKTASFIIPKSEIEARMRSGKLLFKWGQLRDWCSVGLDGAIARDAEIELPLAAVVPLFLATRVGQAPRAQAAPDARIPDIFSKSKESPASTPPPPPPPAPPAIDPEPKPVAGVTAPAQIIERIRALAGVEGAFLSTADGLPIAGHVPQGNENILAAFAPTVFAQLAKYSDMAHLGVPESIDIHLGGGATVHVRKTGKLYLGLLMPPGCPLPAQELTRIANTLQPQTN